MVVGMRETAGAPTARGKGPGTGGFSVNMRQEVKVVPVILNRAFLREEGQGLKDIVVAAHHLRGDTLLTLTVPLMDPTSNAFLIGIHSYFKAADRGPPDRLRLKLSMINLNANKSNANKLPEDNMKG